ncbi:MAG: Uma2 family endonuclease [Pirellulaceae bacterium]|nr:Uma2 family endonuclease [Planctomycetales bacterium]
MATAETSRVSGEERFLVRDVSWDFYKRFCDEIGERPLRLSFTDGNLEIMITKSPHEFYKTILAKLIEMIIFELELPVRSGGNMTFQREDLEKGFEPDECWWIANESVVRKKLDFDFQLDPPPDVAIEIEISRSLVDRIGIYAAMRVPEIWRHDGHKLRFYVLGENGHYTNSPVSRSFPFLSPDHLTPYLSLEDDTDETTRVRRFVDWLREFRHECAD